MRPRPGAPSHTRCRLDVLPRGPLRPKLPKAREAPRTGHLGWASPSGKSWHLWPPAGLAQRQGRGRGLPVPRPPQPPGRRDHRRVSALRAPRSALRLRDAPRWASLCSRLCNDWKGSTNPANRSAPGGGGAGLGRGGLSTARTPGQHLPGTPPPAPAPKASGFTPPGPHTDRSLCRDRPSCGLLGLSLAPLPPRQAGWCR